MKDIILLFGALYGFFAFFGGIISLVLYILRGLGMLGIADGLGMNNGWMGFFPFVSDYLLGKCAEKNTPPDKKPTKWGGILVGISIGIALLGLIVWIGGAFKLGETLTHFSYSGNDPEVIARALFDAGTKLLPVIVCSLALGTASLIQKILKFICLYKVYGLFLPGKETGMLILSIFIPASVSIILFAVRNRTPVYPAPATPYAPMGGSCA